MSMGINGISNNQYNMQYSKPKVQKKDESIVTESLPEEQETKTEKKQITAEEKLKQADEFWAQHDALYAEQMATVMNTIKDGMQTAQEIARRMSSGAKVSPADEQNLQLYDPRMYAAAKQAQMMAQKKKDMSDESLIDQFVERHANDRKDWTSELDAKISEMQQYEVIDSVNETTGADGSTTSTTQSASVPASSGTIDITV
jgi:hypothetical protein